MQLRTTLYTGKIKALQPLAHGGKNSGTVHTFRRETIFGEKGEPIPSTPSISGGTIRYSLRNIAAHIMHEYLVGDGTLPFQTVHAMFNGGAMKETKNVNELITGERQAILRETVPLFAVFGGMGGARSISGRLAVDSAIPITKETAYLAQYYRTEIPSEEYLQSVYSIIEKQRFVRFSTSEGSSVQTLITPESDRELPKGGGMIFWSQEVLPLGSELFHSLCLTNATPVETSFFEEVVQVWSRNAHIGQQVRAGMGKIVPLYKKEVTTVAGSPTEQIPINWREALAERKEEALEALSWL